MLKTAHKIKLNKIGYLYTNGTDKGPILSKGFKGFSQNKNNKDNREKKGFQKEKIQDFQMEKASDMQKQKFQDFQEKLQIEKLEQKEKGSQEMSDEENVDTYNLKEEFDNKPLTPKEYFYSLSESNRDFKFEYKEIANKMINQTRTKNELLDLTEASLMDTSNIQESLHTFKKDFALAAGMGNNYFNFPGKFLKFNEFVPARMDYTLAELEESYDRNNFFEELNYENLRKSLIQFTDFRLETFSAIPEEKVKEFYYYLKYVFVTESIAFFKFNSDIPEHLFYKILIDNIEDSEYPSYNESFRNLIEFGKESVSKLKELEEITPFYHKIVDKELLDYAKKADSQKVTRESVQMQQEILNLMFSDPKMENFGKEVMNDELLDLMGKQLTLDNNPVDFLDGFELDDYLIRNPDIEQDFKKHYEKVKQEENEKEPQKDLNIVKLFKDEIEEINKIRMQNYIQLENFEPDFGKIQEMQNFEAQIEEDGLESNPYTEIIPLDQNYLYRLGAEDDYFEDKEFKNEESKLHSELYENFEKFEYSEDYEDKINHEMLIDPGEFDIKGKYTESQLMRLNYPSDTDDEFFESRTKKGFKNKRKKDLEYIEEYDEEYDHDEYEIADKIENLQNNLSKANKLVPANKTEVDKDGAVRRINISFDEIMADIEIELEIAENPNYKAPHEIIQMSEAEMRNYLDSENVFEQYLVKGEPYLDFLRGEIDKYKESQLINEENDENNKINEEGDWNNGDIEEIRKNPNFIPKFEELYKNFEYHRSGIPDSFKLANNESKENITLTEEELITAIEQQRNIDPTICPDNEEIDILRRQLEIHTMSENDFQSIAYRKNRFREFYKRKMIPTLQKHLSKFDSAHLIPQIIQGMTFNNQNPFEKLYPVLSFGFKDIVKDLRSNLNTNKVLLQKLSSFNNDYTKDGFTFDKRSSESWKGYSFLFNQNVMQVIQFKLEYEVFLYNQDIIQVFLISPQKWLHLQYQRCNYENIVKGLIILVCRDQYHFYPELFHDEKIYEGLEEYYSILFDTILFKVMDGFEVKSMDLLELMRIFGNSYSSYFFQNSDLEHFMINRLQNLSKTNITKFGSTNFDFLQIAFHLNKSKNHSLMTKLDPTALSQLLLNIVWFRSNDQAIEIFEQVNSLYNSKFNLKTNKPMQAFLLDVFFNAKNYNSALATFQLCTFLFHRISTNVQKYGDILERLFSIGEQNNFYIHFEKFMPKIISCSPFSNSVGEYEAEFQRFKESERKGNKLNAFSLFELSFFKSDKIQTIYQSDSIPLIKYDAYKFDHLNVKNIRPAGIDINEEYKKTLISFKQKDSIEYLKKFISMYPNDNYDNISKAIDYETNSKKNRKLKALNFHLEEIINPRKEALELDPAIRLTGHRFSDDQVREISDLLAIRGINAVLEEEGILTEADNISNLKETDSDYSSDGADPNFRKTNVELESRSEDSDESDMSDLSYLSDSEEAREIKYMLNMSDSEKEELMEAIENNEFPAQLDFSTFIYKPYYTKDYYEEELFNSHYRIKKLVNQKEEKDEETLIAKPLQYTLNEEFHTNNKRYFSSSKKETQQENEEDEFSVLDDYLKKESKGFSDFMNEARKIDDEFHRTGKISLKEKKEKIEKKHRNEEELEAMKKEKELFLNEIRNEILNSKNLIEARDLVAIKIKKIHYLNPEKAKNYIDTLLRINDFNFQNCVNGFQMMILVFFKAKSEERLVEDPNLLIEFDFSQGRIQKDYNIYLNSTPLAMDLTSHIYDEIFAYLSRNYKRSYFKYAFSHLLRFSRIVEESTVDKIIKICCEQKCGITLLEMGMGLASKPNLISEKCVIKILQGLISFKSVHEDAHIFLKHYYKVSGNYENFELMSPYADYLLDGLRPSLLMIFFEHMKKFFGDRKPEFSENLNAEEIVEIRNNFKKDLNTFMRNFYLYFGKKFMQKGNYSETKIIFEEYVQDLSPKFEIVDYQMALRIYKQDEEKIYNLYLEIIKNPDLLKDKTIFVHLSYGIAHAKRELGELYIFIVDRFIYSKNIKIDNFIVDVIINTFSSIHDVNNMGEFLRYLIQRNYIPHNETRILLAECIQRVEDDHSKGYIKGLSNQLFNQKRKERIGLKVSKKEVVQDNSDEELDISDTEIDSKRARREYQDFVLDPSVENRLNRILHDMQIVPDDVHAMAERVKNMTEEETKLEIEKIL